MPINEIDEQYEELEEEEFEEEVEEEEELEEEEFDEEQDEEDSAEEEVEANNKETADPNPLIPIVLSNGEVEQIKYQELSKIYEDFPKVYDAYRALEATYREAAPIVDRYNKHEVLREVDYYLKQGIPIERIKIGLAQRWAEEYQNKVEEQNFETETERKLYAQNLQLKSEIEQVSQQVKSVVMDKTKERTLEANKTGLSRAIDKFGWRNYDSLTPEQRSRIADTVDTYYKGIDLTSQVLSQSAYNGIVKQALGEKTSLPAAKKKGLAQKITTSAPPPKMGRGKSGATVLKQKNNSEVVSGKRDFKTATERWNSL